MLRVVLDAVFASSIPVRPNCLVLIQPSAQQQQCRNVTTSKDYTGHVSRRGAIRFVLGQPEIQKRIHFPAVQRHPVRPVPYQPRSGAVSEQQQRQQHTSRSSISTQYHLISFSSFYHRRLWSRASVSRPKSGWIVITFRFRLFPSILVLRHLHVRNNRVYSP